MTPDHPGISIVIPARNVEQLLPECLRSIRPQLRSTDEIIIVDDCSDDATSFVAALHGARVVAMDVPAGPYAARNRGWQAAVNEIICFVDARCRARPGWRDTMSKPLGTDSHIAMVCADIEVPRGNSVAARAMHCRQSMRTVDTVDRSIFLPWFVTANLAVRRCALEAVGGFAQVHSGGDVDLCWRIQLQGLGQLEAVDSVVMDWVPRESLSAFLKQWEKYGSSSARLRYEYRSYGVDTRPPRLTHRMKRSMRIVARNILKLRAPANVAVVDGLATWLFDRELTRALRAYAAEGLDEV